MEKTLAEQLVEGRTNAYYALLKAKHATYSFLREKRALLDESVIDEILEHLNNIEWLWEDAESFLRHRTRTHLSGGREGRARTIGDALGNYVEIQDLMEHEINFLDFLSAMNPQALAKMNIHKLMRMYDDRRFRGNPVTKAETIMQLIQELDMGWSRLQAYMGALFGTGILTDSSLRSEMNALQESISIKAQCGEAALSEHRFKTARNNYQNAVNEVDYAIKLLVYARKHPEFQEDLDSLLENFQVEYEEAQG